MIEALQSKVLAKASGVRHGFFTRRGGVSEGPFESLNVGLGSGDDKERVFENRRRAVRHLRTSDLQTCYQIHSDQVRRFASPWRRRRPKCDGLVSVQAGLALGVLAADCAPILLADPQERVVGALHAGWRGALGGVIEAGVAAMVEAGARRERLVAAVGPCIGPASYEVGLEFEQAFVAQSAEYERFFSPAAAAGKRLFDLPGFALFRLARAGVENAEWIGRDTLAEPEFFFSYRRVSRQGEARYGRLLSAIVIDA
ncbi:MAG: peptidoglycan editing factor PgeF [Caulobacteraceae bacterium]